MAQQDIIADLKTGIRGAAVSLEKLRQLYMILLVVGIGIVSFAVTFLLLYINPEGVDLRYTVTFGALIPSALIYTVLSNLYMKKGAHHFIGALCRASTFQHCEGGCFTVAAAEKHRILPLHNKNRLETGLQGVYRGVSIAIQETVLTELKQDPEHKKKKKEYLRFWGLLVRIKLTRTTDGHTVIIPRAALNTFFRGHFSQFEKAKITPDERFAKIYEILTTDQVEARFAVNGAFRDKFLGAGKALKAYWCEASFRDAEILLAFQRFRPFIGITPLWKPVTEQNLRHHIGEMESLTKIIDVLKANSQIGT